jgi:glycosyltransferase involved in cell wall biosynthesis
MLGIEQDRASTLREALATGVPVVVPQNNALAGHLDAIGAPAYPYGADVIQLGEALHAALGDLRGAGVGAAAREAVLAEGERAADGARVLLGALVDAAVARNAPFAMPVAVAPAQRRDGLHIGVINPHPSAGGGERFLRRLIAAMAEHPSRPRVTLVCQEDPLRNFDSGMDELRALGVNVHQAPLAQLDAVFEQVAADRDVTYYPWPHHAWPPASDKPLVCTFHDVNWRHFDVLAPEFKARLEEQTPAWLERADAIVHSAHFVAAEVKRFYHDDYDAHVIPLTADLGADSITDEERGALRRRHALPEKFVFSPAGRHLHKNYPALSAACRLLREQGRPVSVIATGVVTDTTFHGPDLIGLGYVSERDVSVLYDMSCGVVQTTLYEAGSWPMLEAADVLRPSACSRIPSIVEQVERLGLETTLFDPTSIVEIADALWAMANAPQDPAVLAANQAKVRSLAWSDTAAAYVDVFTEVVEARRVADAVAAEPTPITRVRPALIGAQ